MSCQTCDRFPAPPSKFAELGSDDARHSTLYRCSDCGQLLDLIAEERSTRRVSIHDAFLSYYNSSFWPISVQQLACKSCGSAFDLKDAILKSPYSWPPMETFWHECPECKIGNHIRVQNGAASIIEITGAPGPTWETLVTSRVSGLKVSTDPEYLQIWLHACHRAIPARK